LKTLRLILGDQLNYKHSWFNQKNDEVTYLIIELKQESEYVTHHIQKIIGFFASMFNFVHFLKKNGHQVIYIKINDSENKGSLADNLQHLIQQHQFKKFEFLQPDEYRLDEQLKKICKTLSVPNTVFDTEHFYTSRYELAEFFNGKKNYLLENFYRNLRKKHQVLMHENEPIGNQWNFDSSNRNAYKGKDEIPEPFMFNHNYSTILSEIKKSGIKYIGEVNEKKFSWPTSRKQSLQLMHYFNQHLLPLFGKYQDAMHTDFWSLFHSRLSFSLNIKMISPKEVIESAILEWEKRKDEIGIEQIEGYVRQILGWREYMRGIYWAKMPEYASLNFFQNNKPLPQWFWTGETKMNCLKHAIQQSLQHAYAHHIQRLMVTGNFALLAGIHPDEVDKWYLGIYIDAIEWVEITNTRGMSQFADGGIVGSKPYVSSANYIDKMSNYCKNCYYDKTSKTGEKACPFNSLYWLFYETHRDKLSRNPRIGMMYKVLDKFSPTEKDAMFNKANNYLNSIDKL
jgi:deoxyribodipyrimidine photolyase-related protein